MLQTVNFYGFEKAFHMAGRGHQFSYEALKALFDYYELEYEGTYNLDVIEICCTWTEEELTFDEREEIEGETLAIRLDNGNTLYINY